MCSELLAVNHAREGLTERGNERNKDWKKGRKKGGQGKVRPVNRVDLNTEDEI